MRRLEAQVDAGLDQISVALRLFSEMKSSILAVKSWDSLIATAQKH